MNSKKFLFSFYLISNLYFLTINTIEWNDDENWAYGCDFKGNDLSVNIVQNPTDCKNLCVKTSECTHYVWSTILIIGICSMKKGPINKNDVITAKDNKMVCGIVTTFSSTPETVLACKLVKIINRISLIY
jgi:hypothetical protein